MSQKTPQAASDLFDLHSELTSRGLALMERKNHDYRSGSGDPYKNFRGAETFGVSPVRGILLRMQDKMCRIATFDEKGELLVKDEGVEDAIVDIINYAVLIGGLIREDKQHMVARRALGGPVERIYGTHPAGPHFFTTVGPIKFGEPLPAASLVTPGVRRGLGKGARAGKGARKRQ